MSRIFFPTIPTNNQTTVCALFLFSRYFFHRAETAFLACADVRTQFSGLTFALAAFKCSLSVMGCAFSSGMSKAETPRVAYVKTLDE